MTVVILMRHGDAEQASSDYLRPLSQRGRLQCLATAGRLKDEGIPLNRVLCSSALRAKASAELVTEALEFADPIDAQRSLYLAGPDEYLAALRHRQTEYPTTLLVAHNPGLSQLASVLRNTRISLATADYCLVRLEP